jgi:hypothetical protein
MVFIALFNQPAGGIKVEEPSALLQPLDRYGSMNPDDLKGGGAGLQV